jgi:arsenate reductase
MLRTRTHRFGGKPERRMIHNVLFVCTGNSARSIMAESLIDHHGAGRLRGFSAGSAPKGEVHPLAVQLLAEHGLRTEALGSKPWSDFAAPAAPGMHFVFTVCDQAAGEVCPVWPGQPITAHWGVPDPAAADGSAALRMIAFREAFRALETRIRLFTSLPIAALDRMALTREVERIGRIVPPATEEKPS